MQVSSLICPLTMHAIILVSPLTCTCCGAISSPLSLTKNKFLDGPVFLFPYVDMKAESLEALCTGLNKNR
jgi:hypothetical protein